MAGASPTGYLDASLVTSFLTRLNEAGATAYLLHSGALPGSGQWKGDIDLLVTSDREAFLREMQAAATSLGFSPVLQVPRVSSTLEIDLLFPNSRSWTAVFIDRKGMVLNVDIAFAPRPPPGRDSGPPAYGIPQVASEVGLAYLVIKRVRKGDDAKEVWAQISEHAGSSTSALEGYLGVRLAQEVSHAIARGAAPDSGTLRRARRALRRRRILSLTAIRILVRGGLIAARRSYRPAGAFISLAGVDGSGKSSVSDALVAWSPFRKVKRLHSRPGLLKPPGWFIGRQSSDDSDPHGSRPWGPAMSALRLVYFWADFAVGYWVRVWPVTARGGLVVSERWWWDMYVDPRRHRLRPMPRAARVLGRFIPRAHASFVLDAPSSRIRERKRELSASEIERQRTAWSRLAPAVGDIRTINAAAPLPEMIDEVVQAVLERQGRRIAPAGSDAGSRLIALPRADPRWLVDPGDPDSLGAALRLFVPSRRRALAAVHGARVLAERTPLAPLVLRRLAGHPSPEAESAVEWVRQAAERCIPGQGLRVAAYLGSPGPLRKLSAVVLDWAGQPVLFAKVASSVAAGEALHHEAEILNSADDVARSAVLPNVVGFETGERGAILLLSPVLGSRFANRAPPDERHVHLISALLEQRRPLDGAAHRDSLRERLDQAPESAHRAVLQAALQSTESVWPLVRSAHFSHGDLTPWNCLDCGRALGVVDWEMAGYRIAGWDALHYVVQIEAITRHDAVGRAADRVLRAPFLAGVGPTVTRAADVDMPVQERWPALQLLLLIEGAVHLMTTQPELSLRGVSLRTHAIAHLLGIPPPSADLWTQRS